MPATQTKSITSSVIIEPSKTHPGCWYWAVLADDGLIYVDGEGDQSYDIAVWSAIGAHKRMMKGEDAR